MRIAIFHNLPSGGAKRALFEWTIRLVKNHEVDIYTLSTADHDFCDLRPLVQNHKVYPFGTRRLFTSPWGRLNQLQRWRDLGDLETLNRRIAHEINHEEYDLVFANTCQFTFIPIFLQYLKKPSIYYLHEPFGPGFTRSFTRPYINEEPLRLLLNKFDPSITLYQKSLGDLQTKSVNLTTTLLSNSNYTRVWMEDQFNIKTQVCHYGVDLENFRPEFVDKSNFVISVGELSPRKGFDFLVRSISLISEKIKPSLVLACNAIKIKEKEYILHLSREHNVTLDIRSNQTVDQLRSLFNSAKLCAYAPVMEPFGLVPLEAMASGTPVVGVREGGVQESIIHEYTGLLTDRDENLFAKAVIRLLQHPELANEYGANGRKHVEKCWSWDISTEKLEDFMLKTIAVGKKIL